MEPRGSVEWLLPSSIHEWTLAELLAKFGPLPVSRIRHLRAPGTASEQDVIHFEAREDRLCELIDGVLVEKVIGYNASIIAALIVRLLGNFVAENNLGIVAGAGGTLNLSQGQVRIPDVSFVSWKRLPGGKRPVEPIPQLVPDLAIEVISAFNTREE